MILKFMLKQPEYPKNESINLDEINDIITLKDVFRLDTSNLNQIIETVRFNDGSTLSFDELKKCLCLESKIIKPKS
jgi:hypothetical protein